MRGLSALAIFMTTAPALADVDVFTTPSGNIECSVGLGDRIPADINCTIFERSAPPPTSRSANCNDALGYEFSMHDQGAVTTKCGPTGRLSSSPSSGNNAVRYGDTVKFGRIVCRSSTSGLECRNADGHGFFLSRGRQSVF
jgi:hypothetical protein